MTKCDTITIRERVGESEITIYVGVRGPIGGIADYGSGAEVFVDGSKVGETGSNSELVVTVENGEHTFKAEDPYETCYPASRTLDITSDRRVELIMEPMVAF